MNHPPPIINQSKPSSVRQELPSQTAWKSLFKRIWSTKDVRYAFLWLASGILFASIGKGVLRRREENLLVEELDEFLKNKMTKDRS